MRIGRLTHQPKVHCIPMLKDRPDLHQHTHWLFVPLCFRNGRQRSFHIFGPHEIIPNVRINVLCTFFLQLTAPWRCNYVVPSSFWWKRTSGKRPYWLKCERSLDMSICPTHLTGPDQPDLLIKSPLANFQGRLFSLISTSV